jgi:hypothetical protein
MQDQHGRRFPWQPFSSELVGTAVLVLVSGCPSEILHKWFSAPHVFLLLGRYTYAIISTFRTLPLYLAVLKGEMVLCMPMTAPDSAWTWTRS